MAAAFATKHEVSVTSLGRTQSIQNLMSLQQRASNHRFEQVYKLYNVVTDPETKKMLQLKMLEMVDQPLPTYKEVETSLYGTVDNPITIDDGEEDDEDDVPPSVKDEPDNTGLVTVKDEPPHG